MNLIAAVDMENGIGLGGHMLYEIPEDLAYFKQMTYGKVVVMGRATLLTLPHQKPLPGRTNIVLTTSMKMKSDSLILCHSLQALFETLASYASDDIFIIGGETVYAQLMRYCEKAYITKIQSALPADRHFPPIEKSENWALSSESGIKECNGLRFTYQMYVNHAVKPIE